MSTYLTYSIYWKRPTDFVVCLPWQQTLISHMCEYLNGLQYYSLQPAITIRALNLLPLLHLTVSLYNLIEIIIWKGDFLARCLRGVFSINWSGCLGCLLSVWAICATATPPNFTGVAVHCICTDATLFPPSDLKKRNHSEQRRKITFMAAGISFVIYTCLVINSFEGRC